MKIYKRHLDREVKKRYIRYIMYIINSITALGILYCLFR